MPTGLIDGLLIRDPIPTLGHFLEQRQVHDTKSKTSLSSIHTLFSLLVSLAQVSFRPHLLPNFVFIS